MWNFLLGILGNEVHALLPGLARWLVRRRAAALPSDLRERLLDEWLAEVDAAASHFWCLVFAVGLWFGRSELLREHREAQVDSAAGASRRSATVVDATVVESVHDSGWFMLSDEHFQNLQVNSRITTPEYRQVVLTDANFEWTPLVHDYRGQEPKLYVVDVKFNHLGRPKK